MEVLIQTAALIYIFPSSLWDSVKHIIMCVKSKAFSKKRKRERAKRRTLICRSLTELRRCSTLIRSTSCPISNSSGLAVLKSVQICLEHRWLWSSCRRSRWSHFRLHRCCSVPCVRFLPYIVFSVCSRCSHDCYPTMYSSHRSRTASSQPPRQPFILNALH
ncbi:hypothetical protein PIB30_022916 [Stylosanthes scabra]|uniref:Uncharacterized protein n=1 Tax=Stylosanthes scabra TaxID=79078 RepID=A0ABU6Z622_9FABA|nr:hypothetical protein [Stylosanthes scabra]